jgi:type VI protein secretion system component Hcp
MSEFKYYAKIEGVEGSVKVKGFDKTFQLTSYQDCVIRNQFHAANNGQTYHGTPLLETISLVIQNPSGKVASQLQKKMLDAEPLKEITVQEVTKIKGEETSIYDVKFTNPHLLFFRRDGSEGENCIILEFGAFSQVEFSHYDVDETGKKTPYKVKYDLQKNLSS